MARETWWDLALGLGGLVYLGLVLFVGLEIPLVGVALVVLAVYAIVRPHRSKQHWPQINTDE